MSVHLHYLKHLQCQHLCTVCLDVWDDFRMNECTKFMQKMWPLMLSQCYTRNTGEGGNAADTRNFWSNEATLTKWTRIWPDSIIYSHALFSELLNDWKVSFDLYKCTGGAPSPSPLLVQWSYPNQKHNQTTLTQKHLRSRALCTICPIEAQSEDAKGLINLVFFCTTSSTCLYTLQ